MEVFLALADELHFGRTAERLRLSQAAVSQTLRKLERRIGAPLFERTSRRVVPTPVGKQLHDDLAPAWAAVGRAEADAVAYARGVAGTLTIGFLGASQGELTPRVIAAFRSGHPGTEVRMREVHLGDPFGALRDGTVDLLLTRLPVAEPDLTVGPVVLSEPRMLAVASDHPFARRDSVRMDDLARDVSFSARGPAPSYWWDAQIPPVTPSGLAVRRERPAETLQEMMTLVASGEGIAPVPRSVCCAYAYEAVAYVPIEDAPPSDVALVWRTAAETARIRAFLDATLETLRTTTPAH
ncbi:LysR family transcriptional regulator [Actinomadura logoneensis]|uniref:LysR family transcriptional regulator n=1 Tax=Actinomadura logoneensis TaxID=2293572 RepID=A0A372JAY9_9ACTN|nr:LysR family transcriptional regulator [Actinomadura logoneensis]